MPDRLLAGAARALRCSRCGADFPLPDLAPAAAALPPVPAPTPAPEPPVIEAPVTETPPSAPPPRDRPPVASTPPGQVALVRAWAASLAILACGAVALVAFRSQLMTAWPPATRFFAALGLA